MPAIEAIRFMRLPRAPGLTGAAHANALADRALAAAMLLGLATLLPLVSPILQTTLGARRPDRQGIPWSHG